MMLTFFYGLKFDVKSNICKQQQQKKKKHKAYALLRSSSK